MRRLAMVGWAVVAALVPATACSSGGGPTEEVGSGTSVPAPPASEPSTTTEVTAPEPIDDEAAILEAYARYWDTWFAANDPPNPNHPDLDRYYTGVALERARASIEENRAAGHVIRRSAQDRFAFEVTALSANGDSRRFVACVLDDGVVVDTRLNLILNDEVVTSRIEVAVERVGGEWRVARNDYVWTRPGDPPCGE